MDKMYKQKVEELKKQAEKIDQLQEALLAAGAAQSVIKDYERQLQETQVNHKVLNEELARAKVAASRVAMAVANEYKDDNDKVITVKQWLEERRVLQGELAKIKEKLAAAEKSSKYEMQMKNKAQLRLKVIEECLKTSGEGKVSRSLGQLPPKNPESPELRSYPDEGNPDQASSEDSVSGAMYDALQREVLSLRKAIREKDSAAQDKDATVEMLTKKVELLMRAMEADSRKYRREIATLKDEVASLKAELQLRGPRRSSPSQRASPSPRAPRG